MRRGEFQCCRETVAVWTDSNRDDATGTGACGHRVPSNATALDAGPSPKHGAPAQSSDST